MNAAVLVLRRVWAMEATAVETTAAALLPAFLRVGNGLPLELDLAVPGDGALLDPEALFQRKGPHSLRLVQAVGLSLVAGPQGSEAVPAAAAGQAGFQFYRKYTEGMLRRYMKLSMESGRVPSLLGQEMFRGRVTSYKVRSFEDVVIFVHDVGNCLAKLSKGQQHLIRRIALEEHTQGETAAMLGVSLRTVVRHYAGAIDELTRAFLDRGLLEPLAACRE